MQIRVSEICSLVVHCDLYSAPSV